MFLSFKIFCKDFKSVNLPSLTLPGDALPQSELLCNMGILLNLWLLPGGRWQLPLCEEFTLVCLMGQLHPFLTHSEIVFVALPVLWNSILPGNLDNLDPVRLMIWCSPKYLGQEIKQAVMMMCLFVLGITLTDCHRIIYCCGGCVHCPESLLWDGHSINNLNKK